MPVSDRFELGLDPFLGSGEPVLFLGAMSGAAANAIGVQRLVCEQSFKPEHDRLTAAGFRVTVAASGRFPLVLLNASRNRAQTLALIARGWSMLEPQGTMLINIDKDEGADSLQRTLRASLGEVLSQPRAHGRLLGLQHDGRPAPDWADALVLRRNRAGYLTAPGMFSEDDADAGSKLLAERFGPDLKGRVADLGAGWGYLAAQALARCPGITEMHLYEADHAALEAARQNVTDARAHFHWADATSLTRPDPPFDAVICNPPFHLSRRAEPELGRAFIATAARILKPHGKALLVANRQLPYEAALGAAFRSVQRLDQISAFKLFLAGRPARA